MTLNNYIETIENETISEGKYTQFKNKLLKSNFKLQDDYFKLFICNKTGLVQKLSIQHSNNSVIISR
jgi:hypothetical protein